MVYSTSTDTSTWTSWNDTSTSTAMSNSTYIWTSWVSSNNSTTSSTCSNSSTWTNWNVEYTTRIIPERNQRSSTDQYEERRKKDAEKRKKAEENALNLLLDLIGEEQLKIYKETGRLFVKGNKYDYIIQKSGFIKRVEKDKITDLCVHLDNRYKYPATDNVIAMKLAIESEEKAILKKANIHGSCKRPEQLPKAACM
jgi:hypothetical protein